MSIPGFLLPRAWHSGRARGFHPCEEGSTPFARSLYICRLTCIFRVHYPGILSR
jgi:hypothetical protein